MKAITENGFEDLRQLTPKRIYLPMANVLKRDKIDSNYYGTLNFSFSETIKKFFETETTLQLFPNQYNQYNEYAVWRSIQTEKEMKTIQKWIDQQGTTVFIRSLLTSCIALDVNIDFNNKTRTPLGKLEHQAKQSQCPESIEELVDICCDRIQKMSLYRKASHISAVPANEDKTFDLPAILVKEIASRLELTDLTNKFQYGNAKQMIKEASIEDKWQKLEESDLSFDVGEQRNSTIILLDDKYQSGATMHYVASKLPQTGFDEIYGLTLVKTIRDADNQ